MKKTFEEASQLKTKADNYINRVWKTRGKEFKFISSGVLFNSSEKTKGDSKQKEENYQIKHIRLEAPDGEKLPKTLEQIIAHFKKEDEENKTD